MVQWYRQRCFYPQLYSFVGILLEDEVWNYKVVESHLPFVCLQSLATLLTSTTSRRPKDKFLGIIFQFPSECVVLKQ